MNELINEYYSNGFDKMGYDKPDIKDPFTRWQLILKRMVYCLQQADENQVSLKNKYEEEFEKQVWKNVDTDTTSKFSDYLVQDKSNPKLYELNTSEPDKNLKERYYKECDRINSYRNIMKNEAFNLLKKYFWNLWD